MLPPRELAPSRRRPRSILRIFLLALFGFLAFALVMLAALHTRRGMTAAVNLALHLAKPWRGAEMTVADARRGFLSGIEVYGVHIRQEGAAFDARIDTMRVGYRIADLLDRPLRIRSILVTGVRLGARFPFPRERGNEKSGGGANLAFHRVELRRGSARLLIPAAGRDSVLELDGVALAGSEIRITRGVAFTLDTLAAFLRAPAPPAAEIRIAASGTLAPGRIHVRSMAIQGDRTRISGTGTLVLPTSENPGFNGTDLRLTFAPLAGTDIRRFLPALGDPGDVTLGVEAQGEASASQATALHVTCRARAERGGAVQLEATLPAGAGPAALRSEGRVTNLDLDAILGRNLGRTRLTAQWSTDLAGPDRARLSGPLALDLSGTCVQGARLGRARIEGRFDEGRYSFHVGGAAVNYTLQGSGSVTPLASPLAFDFTGSLSVPRIYVADSTRVLFVGAIPIQARGFVPKNGNPSLEGTAELRPDSSASSILGPGRIALGLDSGFLRCRADVAAASGNVHVDGDLRFGESPTFRVREGMLRDVDLGRLTRDTTACLITARFRGQGQGTRPESMRLTAQLDSIAIRYAGHEIEHGRAIAKFGGGRGRIELKADLDGGALNGWASMTRWIAPREGTASVTFHDVDLSRWVPRKEVPGRWSGNLSGRLERGTARVEGRVASRSDQANLQGTLKVQGSGTNLRTLVGDAVLDFSGSTVHQIKLDALQSHVSLARSHLDATLEARASADSAEMHLTAEPFADPVQVHMSGRIRSDRIAELLGVDSLRAAARVSFDAEAAVPRSGGLRGVSVAAHVAGRASARHEGADEARLDSVLIDGTLTHSVADIQDLVVRGSVLTADGWGQIALPGAAHGDSTSFHLQGTVGSLEPLAPILGLTNLSAWDGRFRVAANGNAQRTMFTGHAVLTRPHLNAIWADSLALDVSGTTRDTTLTNLEGHWMTRSLVVWPLAPRDQSATLDWNGTEASAEVHSLIFGRLPEEIAFHVTPGPGEVRGRLDRFVHTRPSGTLKLQGPVDFQFGKRLFLSDLVMLQDGHPMLRCHGSANEDGTLDFEVHVDSLDLSHVEDLSGLTTLCGSVSLDGTLKGTRSHPVAEGSARALLIAQDWKPVTLGGRFQWANGMLDVSSRFDETADHRLAVEARLPIALTLVPDSREHVTSAGGLMRGKLEAKSFDLSWFQSLLSPRLARGLRGWVDGTVTAEGDPDRPNLSGGLSLQDARVELPRLGIKLEEGTATLGFSGRTARLQQASIKSGGTAEASGTLEMLGRGTRPVNFEVKLHHFTPVNTAQAKAEVDGRIAVTGDFNAPRVKGDLTLRKSTIYAERGEGSSLEPVTLSRRDLLDLEERFGVGVGGSGSPQGFALADSTDLDATIKIGDNIWVRRHSDPVVALELKGDVRVRKPPAGELDVRGTLGIKTGRSYLSFLGRRFEMQSAQVELPGPVDSASVRLEAFYHPRAGTTSTEVDVTATVEIDPSGVSTNLRSEPYLDHASLLNYLATGEVQGGFGSSTAYGLAVGTALGAVGGAAGRSLGLDVVTVTTDAYGGQTLGAGSYVNPKVYLGFRQPVVEGKRSGTTSASSASNTEFEFEVEAMRNLLFNIQGSAAQYRFVLRPRLGR